MSIFDFITKFTAKDLVGIFVSPKSTVEVVTIDKDTKEILKYAQAELPYDLTARQIYNIQTFESVIQDMFSDLDIPLNSSVVVSLPSIVTRHQNLPIDIGKDEINLALISEAEKNYIFKKHEPVICHEQISINTEANTQFILYSAIQKEEILKIEEVLNHIGLNLVAIDSSYNSLIRGLSILGIADENISEDHLWSVLLINVNSLALITLMGDKIIDISEEALALKSFNHDEMYQTLIAHTNERVKHNNPDHLIIVSESNEISAETLAGYFHLENTKISNIEANKFSKTQVFTGSEEIPAEKLRAVSPEVIGSTLWKKTEILVNFNFTTKQFGKSHSGEEIKILGKTIYLTPAIIQFTLLGLIAFSVVAMVLTYIVLTSLIGGMDGRITTLATEKAQKESTQTQSSSQTSIQDKLVSIYENNAKVYQAYNAIGSIIPEKLWVESFEIKKDSSDAEMAANITGKSNSVDDIIIFYQNLIETAKLNNLKIKSLKVAGSSVGATDGAASTTPGQPVTVNAETITTTQTETYSDSAEKVYEFVFGS